MICWWIYAPEDGGEDVEIGSLHVPPSPVGWALCDGLSVSWG